MLTFLLIFEALGVYVVVPVLHDRPHRRTSCDEVDSILNAD